MLCHVVSFFVFFFLVSNVALANNLSKIDGDWYSYKWKYGYTLEGGKGYATITNSPNFEVGEEIVRLTAVGDNSFVGENIYKDGKFYKVKVTLQPDGKLLFEGEKNVKWTMERVRKSELEFIKDTVNFSPEKIREDAEPLVTQKIAPAENIFNQKRFVAIIQDAQRSSRTASNEMQKGGIKARRDKAICDLIASGNGLSVSNWSGKIKKLSANGDGKGVLDIEIGPGISVKTWNNSISDSMHGTLINPASKLFERASAMQVGQMVLFSGKFHSGSGSECVYEASITLEGKISEPEFIMTFSEIRKK